jgi:hypothetical protein
MAVSYAGVVLVFGHEVRFTARTRCWARAGVRQRVSYAVYLVYSGELVQRLGRCASPAGHQRGLPAVHRAVPAAAADVGGAGGAEVIWLSLLNATLCTLRAGADGDDGHRAHRRHADGADRHGRAAVHHR